MNNIQLNLQAIVEELGVYVVALDRPGYGESDPHPKRSVKSLALDIEELADQLNLGPKFYVAGYSMGGQLIWSSLKYIPNRFVSNLNKIIATTFESFVNNCGMCINRLAGAILISPAVNYWWPNLPSNLTNEAFSLQLQQDQWSMRVAHYLPWLSYWWNTQTWFPCFSLIHGNAAILSPPDREVLSKLFVGMDPDQVIYTS